MPVRVLIEGNATWIEPTTSWQRFANARVEVAPTVDSNFYVTARSAP